MEDLYVHGNSIANVGIRYELVFVNSGVSRCIVTNTVSDGIQFENTGPLYIEDTWVSFPGGNGITLTASGGHNNNGMWLRNITVERVATGKDCIHCNGGGQMWGTTIENVHIEGAVGTTYNGVVIDGCINAVVKNVSSTAENGTVTDLEKITNASGTCAGVTVEGMFVRNTAWNLVNDVVNGVTINGAQYKARYAMGEWGSQGTPAMSKNRLRMRAMGIISEDFNPVIATGSSSPTSGTIMGYLVGLHAGDVVTGIQLILAQAAGGTDCTLARFGIANKAGMMLARSNDVKAAANWTLGRAGFPLTAPYTALVDDGYYLLFLVTGTWGTTQPTILRGGTAGVAQNNPFGSNAAPMFKWTAQSDLPIVGNSLTISDYASLYLNYIAAY